MKNSIKIKIFVCILWTSYLMSSQYNIQYEVKFDDVSFYLISPAKRQDSDLGNNFNYALSLIKSENNPILNTDLQPSGCILAKSIDQKKIDTNDGKKKDVTLFLFKQDGNYFLMKITTQEYNRTKLRTELILSKIDERHNFFTIANVIETFFTPNENKEYTQTEKNIFTLIAHDTLFRYNAIEKKIFKDKRFDEKYFLLQYNPSSNQFKKSLLLVCHYLHINKRIVTKTTQPAPCEEAKKNFETLFSSTEQVKPSSKLLLPSGETIIILGISTIIIECAFIIYLLTKNNFKQV